MPDNLSDKVESFAGMAWSRIYYHRYAVLAFTFTMAIFTSLIHIGLSFDKSMIDDHLYLTLKWDKTPVRGEKFAVRSFNSPYGPQEGFILSKYVYGMPGDMVTTGGKDGRDVFVGGKYVGHAKVYTRLGKPLTLTKGGAIPDGYVYIGTPSNDSYDSRYAEFGFVPQERIFGRIVTLF
jgi:conjugal transfer pilin signal peptidase TrbI